MIFFPLLYRESEGWVMKQTVQVKKIQLENSVWISHQKAAEPLRAGSVIISRSLLVFLYFEHSLRLINISNPQEILLLLRFMEMLPWFIKYKFNCTPESRVAFGHYVLSNRDFQKVRLRPSDACKLNTYQILFDSLIR